MRIILETDALLIKFALANGSFRLSAVGGLIHEIKETAASCFTSFSCNHCYRICNQLAHALAGYGCKCPAGSNQFWEDQPDGIEVLMASDLAVSMV